MKLFLWKSRIDGIKNFNLSPSDKFYVCSLLDFIHRSFPFTIKLMSEALSTKYIPFMQVTLHILHSHQKTIVKITLRSLWAKSLTIVCSFVSHLLVMGEMKGTAAKNPLKFETKRIRNFLWAHLFFHLARWSHEILWTFALTWCNTDPVILAWGHTNGWSKDTSLLVAAREFTKELANYVRMGAHYSCPSSSPSNDRSCK